MNCRVFCVIVLISLVPQALLMCFEPSYNTSRYHIDLYDTAPFILVGRVVETRQNKTHQVVKLHVTCVYKAPKEKRETMLHQDINFTMQYRGRCEPPLKPHQSYFFFFEEKVVSRRNKKRKNRKKKKNSASDFTRISLGAPIPVPAMKIEYLERLVELVKEQNPVGRCYNVWSPWSSCTTKCGVGTMERIYPRHQEGKANLHQLAVCHNAPCNGSDTDYEYQPISVKNCKSMELVRVRWCTGLCDNNQLIRTAVSWEIHPTLMLCTDHSTQQESLQYHNVAIPSTCACIGRDTHQKYAVIGSPSNPDQHRPSKKRNIGKLLEIEEIYPEQDPSMELPAT